MLPVSSFCLVTSTHQLKVIDYDNIYIMLHFQTTTFGPEVEYTDSRRVINKYWWAGEKIIAEAKLSADDFVNIDNGEVYIFKYGPPDKGDLGG